MTPRHCGCNRDDRQANGHRRFHFRMVGTAEPNDPEMLECQFTGFRWYQVDVEASIGRCSCVPEEIAIGSVNCVADPKAGRDCLNKSEDSNHPEQLSRQINGATTLAITRAHIQHLGRLYALSIIARSACRDSNAAGHSAYSPRTPICLDH